MYDNKYESGSKTTLFTCVATTTNYLNMPTVGLFILSRLLQAIGVDYNPLPGCRKERSTEGTMDRSFGSNKSRDNLDGIFLSAKRPSRSSIPKYHFVHSRGDLGISETLGWSYVLTPNRSTGVSLVCLWSHLLGQISKLLRWLQPT